MTKQNGRLVWPGRVAGWGLFLIVGLPWSALFMLGERECDMHIGPPCAVSWGAMKLINFLVVALVCWLFGCSVNHAVNRQRTPPGEDEI